MINKIIQVPLAVVFAVLIFLPAGLARVKPKIAVFSGPRATIQNSEPLVTSNKARKKHGLPVLKNPDATVLGYDHLVAQRLSAPVEVFIEKFNAHPLEI